MIDRDTARQEIRDNWESILKGITHPAQQNVNRRQSYVCPICGHGSHGDGLTINPRSKKLGTLKCFGCGFSGDIIALIQKVDNCDFNTALSIAADELGIILEDTDDRAGDAQRPVKKKAAQVPTDRPKAEQETQSADYSEYFCVCRDRLTDPAALTYLEARGISYETAYNYWIGYDSQADPAKAPGAIGDERRPHPTPRIIIPTSKLHYVARAIDPNTPKQYQKLNARNSSPGIFNSRALAEHEQVFIVEGAFDALSFLEVGQQAIALNSKNNGQALLDLLCNHSLKAKRFVICPDNDPNPTTNADTQRQARELCRQIKKAGFDCIVYNVAGNYHDANDALKSDRAGFTQRIEAARQALKSLEPSDFSDLGQATVFCEQYGERVRYSKATGFLVYNGQVWNESDLDAQRLAQELTARQLDEARQRLRTAQDALTTAQENEDTEQEKIARDEVAKAKTYHSYVLKRRGSFQIAATLKESQPSLFIPVEKLDCDPFALNTPSGTVDLRTGELRPHRSEDYCTKICGCDPSDENSDLWERFLDEITCGDTDLSEYLQMIAGMCAVGKVFTEKLTIAFGKGGNGKSSMFNLLAKVFGSYSVSIPSDSLIIKRNQNKDYALANLRAKRFALAAELQEGQRLSTDVVKRLCSTDTISAERKYKDPFEFTPSHSLILFTNHLPEIGTNDSGTWDRIAVIPFNARFRNAETEVKDYAGFLFEHSGGAVLKWIIEGAVKFIESGYKLKDPKSVTEAIGRYRTDCDWLEGFISDECEVRGDYSVRSSDLYAKYTDYCIRIGEQRRSQRELRAAMEQSGFSAKHTKTGSVYCGLRLSEWQAAGSLKTPFDRVG